MDWGDDACISTRYHNEQQLATDQLCELLEDLNMPQNHKKMSLQELRNRGVTPAMLACSGETWRKLVRKHGITSLLEYGVTWDDAKDMGMRAKDLQAFTPAQIHSIGADCDKIMELYPTPKDVAKIGLSFSDMHNVGFNADKLFAIGVGKKHRKLFTALNDEEWESYYPTAAPDAVALPVTDPDDRDALDADCEIDPLVPTPIPVPRAHSPTIHVSTTCTGELSF